MFCTCGGRHATWRVTSRRFSCLPVNVLLYRLVGYTSTLKHVEITHHFCNLQISDSYFFNNMLADVQARVKKHMETYHNIYKIIL